MTSSTKYNLFNRNTKKKARTQILTANLAFFEFGDTFFTQL